MIRRATAAATGAAALAAALFVLLPAPAAAQQPEKKGASKAGAATKPAAPATDYAKQFEAVCATCHGARGHSDMAGVPILAGQPSFYVITQLYLFRAGRRNNELMSAIAKSMSDADMQGYSAFIGTLPPLPAPSAASPPDAERMNRGATLVKQYRCVFCHGPDLSGGQQVPRIAGQREEYVLMTLKGYKDGTRSGYTQAMGAVLIDVPATDLETLAYYAAHLPSQPAKPAGK